MEKIVKLKPIFEDTSYQDDIEKEIKEVFKKDFFYPFLAVLSPKLKLKNDYSNDYLKKSIWSSKIYYSDGSFYGEFNSNISRQLKEYGATWDKKKQAYSIPLNKLPMDIRSTISLAKNGFDERLGELENKINAFDTDEFLKKIKIHKYFDKSLWKIDKEFQKNIEKITIVPQLSSTERERISKEWENNLKLYIKKFTAEQTLELRKMVKDNVFEKGNRREALVKQIIDSYHVTENKAKFWARQETNLLMAKFKEERYTDAGSESYQWGCVKMPHQTSPTEVYKKGDVRYSHGILEGKIFSWKDPPVTTPPNQPARRNNPGQDYNCRCFAIPIFKFKKEAA